MTKILYIPTSTLNFNNILSSESISPKAFYKERAFGYARWFPVAENALENAIILYPSFFAFSCPKSDIEDHPMMIEVSIDEDELRPINDGLYLCDHTIYINPWETRFIFFSEQDKIVTLSLSDSSMETKMLRLYKKNRLLIIPPTNFATQLFSVDDVALNDNAIKNDQIINKYKGLLYGYYIGAYLSANKDDVERTNCLIEIRDIIAAVLSSSDKRQTDIQTARLQELVNIYNSKNKILREIAKVIDDDAKCNSVLGILQSSGIKIPEAISVEEIYSLIKIPTIGEEVHPSINWIEGLISNQERINIAHRQLLLTEQAEIVCIDGKLDSVKTLFCDNNPLFYSWVNEILVDNQYSKNITSYRKELADALTYKAKEVMADAWENCEEREVLNKLRKHLKGEKFDVVWENNLLCSLSSVIIAGDDWEKLLQFMRLKAMTDYRIAFAIYGILVGFANMVRDFTDLLLNQDNKYVTDVYTEFSGQLLHKEIKTQIQANSPIEAVNNDALTTVSVQDTSFESMVYTAVQGIKNVPKEAKDSLKRALNENAANQDCKKFMALLEKYEGWHTKTEKRNSMCEKLYAKLIESNNNFGMDTKKREEELSLFGNSQKVENGIINSFIKNDEEVKTSAGSVLSDTKWINDCASLIANDRAKKQFIEDMEWFVGNHCEFYYDKKKGKVKGHYYGQDTSNNSVLERLRYYIKDKHKRFAYIYTNIPIDSIMADMIKKYGN